MELPDAALIQIYLHLAIGAHGKDGILTISNYREAFHGMPNRAAIWADIDGDDLLIHMEPLDEMRIKTDDIIEMERKAKDGEFN